MVTLPVVRGGPLPFPPLYALSSERSHTFLPAYSSQRQNGRFRLIFSFLACFRLSYAFWRIIGEFDMPRSRTEWYRSDADKIVDPTPP